MQSSPQNIAQLIQTAIALFKNGDIAGAEGNARKVLEIAPGNASALDLIARIKAALGIDGGSQHIPEQIQEKRYLLIESWGHGFWSDVTNVLGYLLLAEITGRIPVTHWGPNSLFADRHTDDAFRYFFEPVSSYPPAYVSTLKDATWFPAGQSAEALDTAIDRAAGRKRVAGLLYLNRSETVAVSDFYTGVISMLPWIPNSHVLAGKRIDEVYRWLMARYLRPVGSIVKDVDTFYNRHIHGRPTIAVHFRGLDKGAEVQRMPNPQSYFEFLDRLPSSMRIFLLSDDLRAVTAFAARYGERVIFTESTRAEGDVGLHQRDITDPVRLGREVVMDVYLALRCDRFFGMGWSNISSIIAMSKPWARGSCGLWGPCVLQHRLL